MKIIRTHVRKFIALSLLLSSIPALAAEMRDGADWSGLYAGVKLAEGWGEAHLGTGRYDPAFPFTPTSVNLHGAGAGLSLGYDWQRENLIYGLGVDVLDTHIEGSTSLYTNPLPGVADGCDSARANCPMHIRQRVENLVTLRLKVGQAYERYAVYGTAGVAAGEVRRDMYEAIQYWGPTGNWGSDKHLATGWTAGAGMLYALSKNVQLQADYLYVDLGKKDYRFTDTPSFVYEQDAAIRFSLLSLGLNYKF
ncbi:outer membrane protein [Thiobacillus thioparus]|uniref:outer membrane protein n=1 Tax=Thiobacillus thioparus TaxID=931 RepID=UPI0014615C11|nr:outer membrane beta-barrel protein [Thiobacillus thioparus]